MLNSKFNTRNNQKEGQNMTIQMMNRCESTLRQPTIQNNHPMLLEYLHFFFIVQLYVEADIRNRIIIERIE